MYADSIIQQELERAASAFDMDMSEKRNLTVAYSARPLSEDICVSYIVMGKCLRELQAHNFEIMTKRDGHLSKKRG